ncbi:hypothetical protein DUNSADRAFT_13754 [Dunaliella salina]|uniref:Uncharacterized protein n=1 Tax=Dunaliella salina TaxID=3046 RepID=A0ABQ7G8R4_DUNSA|nr:hypothetical protein DUNSADRAFT_13754 [Dunaliella salina]|eukprot:KAF5830998.1 hypothetical protein DUNSADRAFT_13754 [Dunaliella salina]
MATPVSPAMQLCGLRVCGDVCGHRCGARQQPVRHCAEASACHHFH